MIKIISSWVVAALSIACLFLFLNYLFNPRIQHVRANALQFNIDVASRTIKSIETYNGGFRLDRVSGKVLFDIDRQIVNY